MRFKGVAKVRVAEKQPKISMPRVSGAVQEATNIVDDVRNLLNNRLVKKLFRLGSEVGEVIEPFTERPSLWNAARAVMGIGKVLAEDAEVYPAEYFDNGWVQPYSRDFTATILPILARYPYTIVRTVNENVYIRLIDLEGARVGWSCQLKLDVIDHVWVRTEHVDRARATIRRLLWEQLGDAPLVMRYSRSHGAGGDLDRTIVFERDDAFSPLPSAQATRYAEYLKRPLSAGVPRSVLLYGPPGTGKTTMARTLVDNLGLRSFRIRVEDVSELENGTLFEAITVFQPEAIIFDDFDRAHNQAPLLETLEFFQRHVKLVVATVNNLKALDSALLRPGRFDEIVLVERMDEDVVRHMLGEYDDAYEDVKGWPIAFIKEYKLRRTYMDPAEAAASMAELAQRVHRLTKGANNDEWETARWSTIGAGGQDLPVDPADDECDGEDDEDGGYETYECARGG